MITIVTRTTTVFVNDKQISRVEYNRMEGKATVYYTNDEPLLGLIDSYDDVTSVGFTSDAQPASLVFNSKGK